MAPAPPSSPPKTSPANAAPVEISPAYVAVALQRYYDAFGITPELVTDETAVPANG
jgi:hypothetical protein